MNLLAALGVLLVQRPAKLPAELDGRFGIRKGYIHRKSFEKIEGEHESKTTLGREKSAWAQPCRRALAGTSGEANPLNHPSPLETIRSEDDRSDYRKPSACGYSRSENHCHTSRSCISPLSTQN